MISPAASRLWLAASLKRRAGESRMSAREAPSCCLRPERRALVSLMFCRPRMALSMGWTGVVVKARLLAVGLRRRRHDWHTEEANVRGVRKEAMVGGGGCEMYYAICLPCMYLAGLQMFASGVFAWPADDRQAFFEANSSPPTTIPFTHSTERRHPLHLLINPSDVLIAALLLRRAIIAHTPYTITPA